MAITAKKKTTRELADAIGISSRQLATNFADGCPRTSVAAIKKWRAINVRSRTKSDGELQEALLRAQLETERQRGIKLKAENTRMINRLIKKRIVQQDLATVYSLMESRLESLSTEIAVLVPLELKDAARKKVENTVRLALKGVSDTDWIGESNS